VKGTVGEQLPCYSAAKALGSATAWAGSVIGNLLYRSHQRLPDEEAAKGI